MRDFFTELKRRKVWLVGGVYVVSAWIVAQVASLVLPNFAAPPWVMPVLLIVLGLGLPLAVILAWAQETQAPEDSDTDDPGPLPLVTDRPSIAVLPFNNLSGDDEHEYLADGMTEEIITLLAQFSNLFVIARNSTFAYKGKSPDIREVGRDLGVRYVLEGSIRRVDDRIRVTVQLIEAANGSHVWAERYDRPLDDIFKLQDQLAEGITGALHGQVMAQELRRQEHAPTDNLDAWGHYVRFLNLGRTRMNREQIERLALSVELDPNFAQAHAQLALARQFYGNQHELSDYMEEAEASAYRALSLAPDDPNIMATAGMALFGAGRHKEGLELVLKGRALSPGNASVLGQAGTALARTGQALESIEACEQAIRLSPRDPELPMWLFVIARAKNLLGEHKEALEVSERACRLDPEWPPTFALKANILGILGRADEARADWQQFLDNRVVRDLPKVTLERYYRLQSRHYTSTEVLDAAFTGLRKAGIK